MERLVAVVVKEVAEVQQKNIFHSRCYYGDKVCAMIIDKGSRTNVVSTFLMRKLGLKTIRHVRPYKLQ